jgi:ubiquinone/menaquinone biosynthesis C-methylase UbiE
LDDFIFPLACQAIPRLCKRLGLECNLPEEIFPAGADKRTVAALNKEREILLHKLHSKHGVSMWDVFDESGIGLERNAIAREFVADGSSLLDVATGRGYFAFACANRGSHVTAVDIMDGQQRTDWWKVFLESSRGLCLGSRVSEIRSDGSSLPVKSREFEAIGCVHAIRNFLSRDRLKETVREMHRVAAKGGKVVIAESSPEAESAAEEVYLAYLGLRVALGWETSLPNSEKLEWLLEQAGFSRTTSTKRRFSRDYAPVEFPSYVMPNQTPRLREEHDRIEKLRSRNGIRPTPVTIVSAVVEV